MQPSKGKSLTLLKLLNHLLQQTSHVMVDFESSTDTLLLRARIHLFITEWFKLNDMSGVNLRGEYSEMRQRWPGMNGDDEDEEDEEEKELEAGAREDLTETKVEAEDATTMDSKEIEGAGSEVPNDQATTTGEKQADQQGTTDSETGAAAGKQHPEDAADRMEVDGPETQAKSEEEADPAVPKQEDLYSVLYHLQVVFTNPPSLAGSRPVTTASTSTSASETPIQAFKRRTGVLLNELSSRRGEAIEMAKSMREAALAGTEETDLRTNEYPAFLVNRRTLEADVRWLNT
jgi:hypothetical protein